MMGRLNHDQQQLFYSFRLDEAVQAQSGEGLCNVMSAVAGGS
jgi:hypothetical protein